MGLCRLFCSVLVLVAFADIALGQGYSGRRREPCPPVCAIFCEFGNVLNSRGCPTCSCNPDPNNPFPPTLPTPCPPGSRPDGTATVCRPSMLLGSVGTRCMRPGSFCSGGAADEPGFCCRYTSNTNQHCPVDNTISTCQITADHCMTDRQCGAGYKCCPRGCGKRCVPAFGELYRPRRGRRPTRVA